MGPRCIICGADDCGHLSESVHEPGPECGCDDCEAQEARDVEAHERAHAPGVL